MDNLNKMFEELSGKKMQEAVGDNAVDNMVTAMSRVVEVELAMFLSKLLVMNVGKFSFSYEDPSYLEFKKNFSDIIARYQVMDGEDKGDLHQKIENMFKDIFTDKYAALGPQFAETTGALYAQQMVNILKSMSIQANVEIYSPKRIY